MSRTRSGRRASGARDLIRSSTTRGKKRITSSMKAQDRRSGRRAGLVLEEREPLVPGRDHRVRSGCWRCVATSPVDPTTSIDIRLARLRTSATRDAPVQRSPGHTTSSSSLAGSSRVCSYSRRGENSRWGARVPMWERDQRIVCDNNPTAKLAISHRRESRPLVLIRRESWPSHE